jgi:hypothetical protein
MKFVDVYDLRARVLPALLCVMPAPLVLWSFYGDQANWWSSGVTIAVTCGFMFLLSRVAREAGKRLQDQLFREWGGPPTTQLLRHCDDRIDRHTKTALHARLGRLCGIAFPTAVNETKDPRDADEAYRAGARWLLDHTRDTAKYALLFKENINFGFQRNALGLKWIGVAIALASALALLIKGGVLSLARPYVHLANLSSLTPAMALSLLLCFVLLAIWLFAITPAAAKRTAFAYSDRLLEAANTFD